MSLHRWFVYAFIATATLVANSFAFSAEPEVKLLWPNGAPDAKGDKDEDKPTIAIHRPTAEKNVHSAVVICPGGGYRDLAMSYEGHDMAKWFAERGITGIVLKYRLNNSISIRTLPRCTMRNVQFV